MKTPASMALAAILGSPLAAQALNEPFTYSSTATFPPAGWTKDNLNGSASPGWEETSIQTHSLNLFTLVLDAAGHDDQFPGITSDNGLRAPSMDLSASVAPWLSFDSEVYYAQFMAHHPQSLGNGVSTVDLSVDGGVTWTVEWTEASILNGFSPDVQVDLGSYAGQAAVDLRFHYFGAYAHCWGVDNVLVDEGQGSGGPQLSVSCGGGNIHVAVSGCTPGGMVAIARGPGGIYVHGGPVCSGLQLDLNYERRRLVWADGNGDAQWSQTAGAGRCGAGILVQAVDVATCTTSSVQPL